MNRKTACLLMWCLAWGMILGLVSPPEAARYLYHDLGTLGGLYSEAYAINDQGRSAALSA